MLEADYIKMHMKHQYLLRFDDACPTMKRDNWHRIELMMDDYSIRPMVGVIPHNEDPQLLYNDNDDDFWNHVRRWETKGWTIAMHGYNHVYSTQDGGINPVWDKSEFAGNSIKEQRTKIKDGFRIFLSQGIHPAFFFAPSHTFDNNTLVALMEETDIRKISDTVGRYPYRYNDFCFVPQISGHCVDFPLSGIYTFCYHPNAMKDEDFIKLNSFIEKHHESFVPFDEIEYQKYGKKLLADRFLSWLYFQIREYKKHEKG